MSMRLREMALEAVMVVFAVVVALAVEEWRDEQGLRDFADRARAAVMVEARSNLDELERVGPKLDSAMTELGAVVQAQDLEQLTAVALELPEISSAAWTAAQVSQAAPYLDYDWMIRVARAYESYGTYRRVADQAVDRLADVVARGPTLEVIGDIYGSLVLLDDIHAQIEQRFHDIVEAEGE